MKSSKRYRPTVRDLIGKLKYRNKNLQWESTITLVKLINFANIFTKNIR